MLSLLLSSVAVSESKHPAVGNELRSFETLSAASPTASGSYNLSHSARRRDASPTVLIVGGVSSRGLSNHALTAGPGLIGAENPKVGMKSAEEIIRHLNDRFRMLRFSDMLLCTMRQETGEDASVKHFSVAMISYFGRRSLMVGEKILGERNLTYRNVERTFYGTSTNLGTE